MNGDTIACTSAPALILQFGRPLGYTVAMILAFLSLLRILRTFKRTYSRVLLRRKWVEEDQRQQAQMLSERLSQTQPAPSDGWGSQQLPSILPSAPVVGKNAKNTDAAEVRPRYGLHNSSSPGTASPSAVHTIQQHPKIQPQPGSMTQSVRRLNAAAACTTSSCTAVPAGAGMQVDPGQALQQTAVVPEAWLQEKAGLSTKVAIDIQTLEVCHDQVSLYSCLKCAASMHAISYGMST